MRPRRPQRCGFVDEVEGSVTGGCGVLGADEYVVCPAEL
jgi:hypothetical protein